MSGIRVVFGFYVTGSCPAEFTVGRNANREDFTDENSEL
jgi:hypothetical protein